MNTKRITFWIVFLLVLALIVWGLAVAINKQPSIGHAGTPPPVSVDDHVTGSPDASVTLIEYGDFQCPACEAYYPMVEKLLSEESSSTLRFVFRHFPLPQHANAIPAATAAEAAGSQGRFWDMYNLLFSHHLDWTELTDPTPVFVGYAKDVGLDEARFSADLASKDASPTSIHAHIQNNIDTGISIGINATPTFFVNGRAIVNPQSYEAFKSLIDAAIAAH